MFEAIGEDDSEVKFHALANLSADAIAQVQNEAKRRIERAFVKRGLLDSIDAEVMLLARHGGGFSVDASVCIAGDDRAGLERLLQGWETRALVHRLLWKDCTAKGKIICLTIAPNRNRVASRAI